MFIRIKEERKMNQIIFAGLLCLVVSGCGTLSHSKAKTGPQLVATSEVVKLSDKEDKVWIEAKTSKVWIGQHVDVSGDLVEGHYKHVVVTPGHWVDVGASSGQE